MNFASASSRQLGLLAAAVSVLLFVILPGCAGPSLPNIGSASPEQSEFISGAAMGTLIEGGFLSRDPNYRQNKSAFGLRLRTLAGALAAIQATGNDMACSTHIYLEAQWLFHYTSDWARLDRKLTQLSKSLENRDQAFALEQSPETHSWGICYDEWFFQAEDSLAWLRKLHEEGRTPPYPVYLPEEIETPPKLKAYLDDLLVSNVAATGRDNRGELGNITTSLSTAMFKEYLHKYLRQTVGRRGSDQGEEAPDGLAAAYEDFIDRWQDPQSGYWGAWYLTSGHIYKTSDLSITYHTIAYRKGQVAHWPQIIDTTLRIKGDPYPFGWLHDGQFNNHNNYDVTQILKFGWPHMTMSQKRLAAKSLHDMLSWTLTESLNGDGSFKLDTGFFSSVAAEYYFGVSFLDQIGYWDRKKRFWTNKSFPESASDCRRIRARLLGLSLKDPQALDTLEVLDAYCGP